MERGAANFAGDQALCGWPEMGQLGPPDGQRSTEVLRRQYLWRDLHAGR